MRRHIRNALNEGATKEEILEAIQLTSIIDIAGLSAAIEEMIENGQSGRV
ncbi:hypothetical protein [Roseovarius sp. SYSU LYC5161]